MKFITSLSALLALIASTLADSVSFENTYDNKNNSLATVSCSDGANGLLTKGFTTFGSLPTFPNIGGAQAVEGYNSSNCGTCWALTFGDTTVNGTLIPITATLS
jgi:hypothetical protein